jgi:type II secretory pathway component PulF
MPLYSYRALDHRSQEIFGRLKAGTEKELEHFLSLQGLTLVEAGSSWWGAWQELWQPKFSEQKLRDFTYLLKLVYSSGISLLDGLRSVMEGQVDKKLRSAIQGIHAGVESGKSLSECMQERPDVFPDFYVQMIMAGEISGTLDRTIDALLDYLEWQIDFNKKVRSFFVYPVTILLIVTLVGAILLIFVFPGLMKVFAQMKVALPLPTRILLGISGFAQKYYLLLGGLAAALFVFLRFWSKTPDGRRKLDAFLLALPVFGFMIARVNLSRYFKTLATLYSSGLEIQQAFSAAASVVSNRVIRERLAVITNAIAGGESISRAMLDIGFIQPLVVEMIAMGEKTGELEMTLRRICGIYDREVPETIKKMFAIIEPLTVLVMGGMVLVILLAIFLPIYGIATGIKVR